MIKLTLTGKPLSTQHAYRSTTANGYNRTYMIQTAIDLKEDYQWQIKSQYKKKPLTEALKLTATLFFGDKRARDIDNYNKLLLDALSGLVYEDDKQIQELTIKKDYDKKSPRIEVTISLLDS